MADAPLRTEKPKRKLKDKKQIIDSVTELQNGMASRSGTNANPLNVDTASITSSQQFLPRSSTVMKLLAIHDDPVSYFLPTEAKAQGTFIASGPPGLTPELAELFFRPISSTAIQKRKAASSEGSPSKRIRRDELELPRRLSSVVPGEDVNDIVDQSMMDIDSGFNFADQSGTALDDFQLDVLEVGQDLDQHREKSVITDRSRLSSVAPEGLNGESFHLDASCPIAMFDVSQASNNQIVDAEQDTADIQDNDKQGYSKNTGKALSLIRKELQPAFSGKEQEPKAISFQQLANKVSVIVYFIVALC